MKISVDYDELKKIFSKLIDAGEGCNTCPYYDKCDGMEDSDGCAELFINQIFGGMKNEEN